MKRYLKELVLLLAVFGGLPFDVMSDSAYAQTPSLRINGVKFPDGSNAVGGVINVKAPEYNCKGDGVTDDRACIAAAVAAAGSGGVVLLPKSTGSYLISSPLTLANVTVTGEGATIAMTGSYSSQSFLAIGSNVRIHHINISAAVAVGGGVTLLSAQTNSANVEIDHVNITGSTTSQAVSINATGVSNWSVHDNNFSAHAYGVLLNAAAFDMRGLHVVNNNFATIYGDAVELNNPIYGTAHAAFTAGWNIIVANNTMDTTANLSGAAGGFCVGIAGSDYVNVTGNICKSDQEGIHVEDFAGVINVSGNSISSTAHAPGINVIGGSNVSITNNIVRNAATYGIFFSDDANHTVTKATIIGNQLDSNGSGGIQVSENGTGSHIRVSDNQITSNTGDGILVVDAPQGIDVSNNSIHDNTGCGINISRSGLFATYKGNTFSSNTSGSYCFPTAAGTTVSHVEDVREWYPTSASIGSSASANVSTLNMQNAAEGDVVVRVLMNTTSNYAQSTYHVRWNGTSFGAVQVGDTTALGPMSISGLVNSSNTMQVKVFNGDVSSRTFSIDLAFNGWIQGGTAGGSNVTTAATDNVTVVSGGTVDLSSLPRGRAIRYTLANAEAGSIAAFTNGIAGETYLFEVCQGPQSGGTVTWPTNVQGFPRMLQGVPGSTCVRWPFTYDGTNYVGTTPGLTVKQFGSMTLAQISAPSAPTVTPVGVTGATTYTYTCAASDGRKNTNAPNTTSIANGFATLDGSHSNTVTCSGSSGVPTAYLVYRTVGGASQGLIGTVAPGASLSDTGLAAGAAANAANLTGDLQAFSVTFGDNSQLFSIPVIQNLTTSSIGGSALVAGQCITADVTATGATTSMAVVVSPNANPGAGFSWMGYVPSSGFARAVVCAIVAGTPTASTYNVRVIK